jgi:hypothetical protein
MLAAAEKPLFAQAWEGHDFSRAVSSLKLAAL